MRIPFVKKDTLADTQALFDRLNAKLTETINAEAASDEVIQRLYASNAPDAEIDAAEDKHLGITTRREHLLDAVTAAEMKLDAAKKEAADVSARKQTDKKVAQLRAMRKEIPDFKRDLDAIFARGAELFGRVVLHAPVQAMRLEIFMHEAPADIETTLGLILDEMEILEQQIECGAIPAVRPQAAPAQTTTLIALRPVAFFDVSGKLQLGRVGSDVVLPNDTARRAHESQTCLPLNYPEAQQARFNAHYWQSSQTPDLAACVPLDDRAAREKSALTGTDERLPEPKPVVVKLPKSAPRAQSVEKIVSDHFQSVHPDAAQPNSIFVPLDRGKSYTASIAATRSAIDE